LLEQPCNKSDHINMVVTIVNKLFKLVDNLGQAVRIQLVDDLLQDVRFLRVHRGIPLSLGYPRSAKLQACALQWTTPDRQSILLRWLRTVRQNNEVN
jgi:hypothetical protein